MSIFKQEEKKKQNIKSLEMPNGYAYKCMFVGMMIIAIVCGLNWLGIFVVDNYLMQLGFLGTCVIVLIAHTIKKTIGFKHPAAGHLMLFLLCFLFTFLNCILTYHTSIFFVFPLICSVLYHQKSYMIYTYFLSCLGIVIATYIGFHWGLCDANMLILTSEIAGSYIAPLTNGISDLNHNSGLVLLYFAVPKIIALSGVMVMVQFIKTEIERKTRNEIESRRKAETDALTGIYNRNKYIELVDKLANSNDGVAVIFIDINNLKYVNDHKGHEFGDILIIGLANLLKNYMGNHIKVFRIGGDEFVVLIDNPQREEGQQLLEELQSKSKELVLEHDMKLSIATGLSVGPARYIKNLIAEADEKMYINKEEMKSSARE